MIDLTDTVKRLCIVSKFSIKAPNIFNSITAIAEHYLTYFPILAQKTIIDKADNVTFPNSLADLIFQPCILPYSFGDNCIFAENIIIFTITTDKTVAVSSPLAGPLPGHGCRGD